jgi:DNA processing protein
MQGVRDAKDFARALSDAGYTIVSGLALGIDAAAHEGGLSGRSSSVAVLGTGVDRIYPRANHALFDRLQREGTIVSDWPLGTPPLPGNFPRRNRLISGLSRGVLVVEAAPESGSLITARLANEQGREVFAIPGSIHSPLSRGCHELIQEGAKLVTSLEDVLVELTGVRVPRPTGIEPATAPSHPLLDLMGYSPVTIDQMAQRTGHSVSRLAAELFRLEVEGRVAALAGGFFQRLGTQPH